MIIRRILSSISKKLIKIIFKTLNRKNQDKILMSLNKIVTKRQNAAFANKNSSNYKLNSRSIPDISTIDLNDPILLGQMSKSETNHCVNNSKNSPKVYIFNDTSFSNHSGCKAVMRSINHHLSNTNVIARHYVNQFFYNKSLLEKCDIILVNGEGTIHHAQKSSNFLMEILKTAQELGKKTMLINSVFQQEKGYYENVIAKLDFLSVREPKSFENAKLCGGNPIMLLDSCADKIFLTDQKPLFEMSRISKGNTVACGKYYNFIHSLPYSYYPIIDSRIPFEHAIATLKTTGCYITGQHHAVYACGLAGSPFVAIPSNSHKIEGIIEWSKLPIPIYKDGDNIEQLAESALDNQKMFLEFRDFLLSNNVFTYENFKKII